MARCRIFSKYRGPLTVMAVGIGFMIVGAIPVLITLSMGQKSSATIIGVGFIGFGMLLLAPGLLWCLVRRTITLPCCMKDRLRCSNSLPDKIGSLRASKCLLEAEEGQVQFHDQDVEETATLEVQSPTDTGVKVMLDEEMHEDDDDDKQCMVSEDCKADR